LELSRRHGAGADDEGGASSSPSPAAVLLMDYSLDGSKMQPDGDDYKLVFISSDSSSKESNSDVELALDDCDWDYFESTVHRDKKRDEPPPPQPPTAPALLGTGAFGSGAYGSNSFSDMSCVLERHWTSLQQPSDALRLRHPCESCGFDNQHLLQVCKGLVAYSLLFY